MKRTSTLIYLVNQFNPEFSEPPLIGSPEMGFEEKVQENCAWFAPPERSVNAILSYARSLEVADTEVVGKVEWILN